MSKPVCYINITNCARCGGNHKEIWVKAFTNPPNKEDTHFAMCPKLKEPILVGVEKEKNETPAP